MKETTIGLDWDGTISDYTPAFSFLAGLFSKCLIITINDEITVDVASSTLNINREKVTVEICPYAKIEQYPDWKAETCSAYEVDIMFDDDPDVVLACLKRDIKAITVSEFIYKYSDKQRYGDE